MRGKTRIGYNMYQELRNMHKRFEALSRRIRKMNKKIDNVLHSNAHYIKKRLPGVLKNQKKRAAIYSELFTYRKNLSKFKLKQLQPYRTKKGVPSYVPHLTRNQIKKLESLLKRDLRRRR